MEVEKLRRTRDLPLADGGGGVARANGRTGSDGFTTSDIDAIATSFGVAVPAELELLLRVAVPVSAKWARWVDGPDRVAAEASDWIARAFTFDIQQGRYWYPPLGEAPSDASDAVAQMHEFVSSAPPLLPVYAHRFLTTTDAPRAVLSVWQAVDSILYGNDLADYFSREFGLARPSWATAEAPRVPVWEDLFDLFGTWMDG